MKDVSQLYVRKLESHAEYEGAVVIQEATWGDDFREKVPPSIHYISQRIGGIVAGAFKGERMVGFVFSMPGYQDGLRIQWSDLLAVLPEYRGLGIGKRLKFYQRDRARKMGYEAIFWSFDPLEARNAALNIGRLRAVPTAYVPEMYASGNRSELHTGLAMDRLVVKWDLASNPPARRPVEPDNARSVLQMDGRTAAPVISGARDAAWIRVDIPADIQQIKKNDMRLAAAWRSATRDIFQHYLSHHYSVQDFHLDRGAEWGSYILRRQITP